MARSNTITWMVQEDDDGNYQRMPVYEKRHVKFNLENGWVLEKDHVAEQKRRGRKKSPADANLLAAG